MGVEDLLQKHALQEADIVVQADRMKIINAGALKFTEGEGAYLCSCDILLLCTILHTLPSL